MKKYAYLILNFIYFCYMSKSNQDLLFTLIQSLGKAEKRHFKVYSSKHVIGAQNIYVSLFDAVERQKEYNEDILRANKLFRHFSSFKKRLYDSILQSLEIYHSSTGINIRSLLNRIEILFNRSLFEHCTRQIRKAKKISLQYEMFEEWLEILKWEYKIAVKKFDMALRMRVLEEEKRVLHLLNNQKKYRDLANLFSFKYQQYGTVRSPGILVEMQKHLNSPLLHEVKQALSVRAKQNFYDCHYLFALLREDYKNCYRFSKYTADMYLEKHSIIPINASSYLTAINNLLVACNGLEKYKEMLEYLDILEETRKGFRSPSDKALAFFYLYHLLNYFISTGLFTEAEEHVKRMEAELADHEKNLNQLQKIILYATIAQVHFGMENNKRCLAWLKRIMALGEMKVRTDIECFVRLFYLIVHFEAKSDKEFMSSVFKSTYRFLYKHQRMYKFEASMMQFMRQNVVKENRRSDLKEPFVVLRKKLEQLALDPYEKHALNYFDFISWLDSKIENKSFASIVRRKTT